MTLEVKGSQKPQWQRCTNCTRTRTKINECLEPIRPFFSPSHCRDGTWQIGQRFQLQDSWGESERYPRHATTRRHFVTKKSGRSVPYLSLEIQKTHIERSIEIHRSGSSHSKFFNFSCFSSGRAARALTVSAKHVAPPSGGVCLALKGNSTRNHGFTWILVPKIFLFVSIKTLHLANTLIFILAISNMCLPEHVFGKASWRAKIICKQGSVQQAS